ncbi:LacI family DNA-binding transcriptional regulator [Winogradskyella schleiferi]|uniref:LacI family DNA-binding transcriptional regulator n=1 Tax=Winogradskyella schleiferi TaxID=2686078 RepID=UPI0015BDD2DE|nr:LacI family DNA-binding transcriptional regulator [Winogradskyella schleiferi]
MKKEVTLRQIAELLNLSVSTVSKALSQSQEISSNTKNRVKKMADAMHYKPNYFATKLRGGHSKTIGVILPTILNPYYAELLTGIEKVLATNNYKMMTLFSKDSIKREEECINNLTDGSTEGIILSISRETQLTKSTHHLTHSNILGIPRIYVDRLDNTINEDHVVSDDYDVTYSTCLRLLKNTSAKHIIFVSLMGGLTIEELRYQGYKTAMIDNELEEKIKTIRTTDPHILHQELLVLIRQDKVDAIICANDSTTQKVLDIINNEDSLRNSNVHIVGCCAEHVKSLSRYPFLHIIDQCAEDLGKKAAKALLIKISSNELTKPQVYHVKSKISMENIS